MISPAMRLAKTESRGLGEEVVILPAAFTSGQIPLRTTRTIKTYTIRRLKFYTGKNQEDPFNNNDQSQKQSPFMLTPKALSSCGVSPTVTFIIVMLTDHNKSRPILSKTCYEQGNCDSKFFYVDPQIERGAQG